jgi:chromosome segregation ATPase
MFRFRKIPLIRITTILGLALTLFGCGASTGAPSETAEQLADAEIKLADSRAESEELRQQLAVLQSAEIEGSQTLRQNLDLAERELTIQQNLVKLREGELRQLLEDSGKREVSLQQQLKSVQEEHELLRGSLQDTISRLRNAEARIADLQAELAGKSTSRKSTSLQR